MSNARNSHTTHPRREARRQRAAARFHVNGSVRDPAYWTAKEREAMALGLDFAKVERRYEGTTSLGDLTLRKAAREEYQRPLPTRVILASGAVDAIANNEQNNRRWFVMDESSALKPVKSEVVSDRIRKARAPRSAK